MNLENLFEAGEKVLKGELPLEELEKFPVKLGERQPFKGTLRRSALIVSADKLNHLKKVFQREADVINFNLEDGVADKRKDFARTFLSKFLSLSSFYGDKEVVIRVNPLNSSYFWRDVFELLPTIPHAVRLSKVTSPKEVVALDGIISAFENSHGLAPNTIKIHLSIETPSALENLDTILSSSKRVTVAYLGILDLFANLKISQSDIPNSPLSNYVKSKFVLSCKSLRVVPIAPAYQNYEDLEGFREEALEDKRLGFEGKLCISVRQVKVANEVFSPSKEEIEEAKRIVELYEEALKEGKGGVSFEGKFIDQPIYKDALNKLRKSP